MSEERYYTLDDPEHGVTHEQLGTLSPEEQREYMLAWFHRMFEDPANETPYQSSEGGYLYIWGGPYDARDQIESQFHDVASQELMDEVIDEVESNGISDWAPGPGHPDHLRAAEDYYESQEELARFKEAIEQLEAGAMPVFGSAVELKLRTELTGSASEVLELLNSQQPEHGGMGHNRPPIDDGEYALPVDVEAEIREATKAIATEASKANPDALVIAKASNSLTKLKDWGKGKADAAADEFAKHFGKAAGTTAGASFIALLATSLAKLLGLSWDWLLAILPAL